jgi:peptidoglycan/LPS O-acetylase OafA/YrhL
MSVASENDYRSWIDVCKCIACVSVLYYHVRLHTWVGVNEVIASGRFIDLLGLITLPFKWGGMGVSLFFVLSGYCIHLAYKNRVYNLTTISGFYLGRILKLYPILIFSCLVVYLIVKFSGLPNDIDLGDVSLTSFLSSLNPFTTASKVYYGFNGVLWTLVIEIQLYLAYPILNYLYNKLGLSLFVSLVAVVNIISICMNVNIFTSYLLSWWVGALLSDAHRFSPRSLDFLSKGAVGLGLLFLSLIFALLADVQGNEFVRFLFWSFIFCIILNWLREIVFVRRYFFIAAKELGKACYSIYILHIPVLYLVHYVMLSGEKMYFIGYSLLVWVLVLVICYILYILVEKRLDEIRKLFLKSGNFT